jgi:hypothetical protein
MTGDDLVPAPDVRSGVLISLVPRLGLAVSADLPALAVTAIRAFTERFDRSQADEDRDADERN